MTRLPVAVSCGASWLWAFACSLQKSLLQGICAQHPGTRSGGWCGRRDSWGQVELRMWPLRAEHCWLLPKVSPREVGVRGSGISSLSSPPPGSSAAVNLTSPSISQTQSSVHCCSLSPCVPCQEPKGFCAGPNPHPPRQHLGGSLKN